jgi:hypothetical protein
MPRKTIYFPHDVYTRAIEAKLPITAICQAALLDALEGEHLTVSAQIRRVTAELERVAEECDRRTYESYDRMLAAGLDVETLLADTAYLKDRHVIARTRSAKARRAASAKPRRTASAKTPGKPT